MVWGSDNVDDPASARAVADAHLRMMGCVDEGRRQRVFGVTTARMLGLPA